MSKDLRHERTDVSGWNYEDTSKYVCQLQECQKCQVQCCGVYFRLCPNSRCRYVDVDVAEVEQNMSATMRLAEMRDTLN